MARKWFQLVGEDGNAMTSADYVAVDIEEVAAFRKAVKNEYSDSHLAGIAPSDLKVFANGVALEEDPPIGSFGGSKKDALIVQVPRRAESDSRYFIQPNVLFHTYEEYANQWGHVPSTKFSTCVPFKGYRLSCVDDDVIEPFLAFVKEIIANNDDEVYDWLIKWIAHIYKYPNSRTRCALILLSIEEGTGKGTFCDVLTYLFGIHNIDQSGGSVKSLISERSSHLVGKKFAMVQEMRENKGDYMGCMEALKTFITDNHP